MFAAAVLTNSVLYYTTRWFLQKPLLAPSFTIPTRRDTPAALFLGAAMFGAGWAIGGFCPGPAIVAAWEGNPRTLAFVVSMVAGMGLYRLQASVAAATAARSDDARAKAHPALSTALISVVATVSLALTAWVYYTASTSGHSAQVARNTFYLHPVRPAIGGALIGTAVAGMMALSGEILGISGIVGGLFSSQTQDKSFRASFAAGLLAAAALMWATERELLVNRMHRPLAFFIVGGFLVGYVSFLCGCLLCVWRFSAHATHVL